mmetsp:Transcript_37744/g.52648  ORF Transcript_37744/g.52648 Transcript_37744/m.52648 type:complete len:114 (+) Transcript_37744:101-442(+)
MTVRMAIIMCSIVPMSVRLVPVALVSTGRMGPMTVRLVPMGLVAVGLVTTALRHALNMIVAMIQRTVIATSTSVSYHLPEHLHLEGAVSDSFSLDDRNRLTQSPPLMLRRIDN